MDEMDIMRIGLSMGDALFWNLVRRRIKMLVSGISGWATYHIISHPSRSGFGCFSTKPVSSHQVCIFEWPSDSDMREQKLKICRLWKFGCANHSAEYYGERRCDPERRKSGAHE